MPIRILHIIGNLKLGGAQVCLKYLVENASRDEIETFVFPLRSKDIDIPIDGNIIKLPYPNYDPRKFFAILSLCKKLDIDIIHAHLHKPIIAGLIASFFCRVRVVVHEHGPIFRKGIQYSLYRFLMRFLGNRADRIIAVSQATADRLIQKAGIKPELIKVVPNAVDFDVFDPQGKTREKIREQLGIDAEDIVIGYMGRLDYIKGVDLLIAATALLLEQSPRYMLLLAGDGSQRQILQEQSQRLGIAGRVRFMGFCENVAEIVGAFDVAVIPSRQEPFGMAALELMRMKIPLVCSAVDGLAEFVCHEKNVLVPTENNSADICHCIKRLANDPVLCEQLTDAAYLTTERFGLKQYTIAVEELYISLLDRKGHEGNS